MFSEEPEYKILFSQLVRSFSLAPSVAALALLATNFAGTDAAILYVLDKDEDSGKMRHPFIGYVHPLADKRIE